MTTGSRGLHVVAPLKPETDFDTVRTFARDVAEVLARRYPDELTTSVRKDRRGGRVFLDVGRNAYAQTAVAPYAVRARPGAPVATPLDWEEVDHADLRADRYRITNVFRRLGQKPDPWANIARHASSLHAAQRRLEEVGQDERGPARSTTSMPS